MPVRWLLADEVGLGKTIEAALIMNRLLHTQQIERCLVVAPEALTVQWLGELWRKYHHVFTLLDAPRLADVERDFGAGFNPFDVHRRAVVALETLVHRPRADGAGGRGGHRPARRRRGPAAPASAGASRRAGVSRRRADRRARPARPAAQRDAARGRRARVLPVAAVAAAGRVPRAVGRRGAARRPACRCRRAPARRGGSTSAGCRRACRSPSICRRPPFAHGAWPHAADRGRDDPIARRRAVDRVRRALASGAALKAVLGPDETALREEADALDRTDPRLAWLLAQATRWRRANEKTLVFVAHRETLEMLRDALSARAQLASGVFHEELSAVRRDTEVARFRAADGPSLLVSTEAGGEGRNFEFCHRLVLYDLPWRPSTVEQRIGRLDRIGRRIPVEIVYFRPASGIGADVVRLFERLGLFREPIAGLEPQLAHIERALEAIAVDPDASLSEAAIEQLIAGAQAARTRIHEAAYQQLHRDPYRADLGPSILARIPTGLDALMERVVVAAASRLGFRVEQVRGQRAYAIEFGNEALIDSLPGVPGGSSFVGSFDREYAVEDENIDFFASGHALVEGLLAHFDEDPKGRVARLEVRIPGESRRRGDCDLQGRSRARGPRLRRGRAGAAGLGGCVPAGVARGAAG